MFQLLEKSGKLGTTTICTIVLVRGKWTFTVCSPSQGFNDSSRRFLTRHIHPCPHTFICWWQRLISKVPLWSRNLDLVVPFSTTDKKDVSKRERNFGTIQLFTFVSGQTLKNTAAKTYVQYLWRANFWSTAAAGVKKSHLEGIQVRSKGMHLWLY